MSTEQPAMSRLVDDYLKELGGKKIFLLTCCGQNLDAFFHWLCERMPMLECGRSDLDDKTKEEVLKNGFAKATGTDFCHECAKEESCAAKPTPPDWPNCLKRKGVAQNGIVEPLEEGMLPKPGELRLDCSERWSVRCYVCGSICRLISPPPDGLTAALKRLGEKNWLEDSDGHFRCPTCLAKGRYEAALIRGKPSVREMSDRLKKASARCTTQEHDPSGCGLLCPQVAAMLVPEERFRVEVLKRLEALEEWKKSAMSCPEQTDVSEASFRRVVVQSLDGLTVLMRDNVQKRLEALESKAAELACEDKRKPGDPLIPKDEGFKPHVPGEDEDTGKVRTGWIVDCALGCGATEHTDGSVGRGGQCFDFFQKKGWRCLLSGDWLCPECVSKRNRR